jgi:hypothetical protein
MAYLTATLTTFMRFDYNLILLMVGQRNRWTWHWRRRRWCINSRACSWITLGGSCLRWMTDRSSSSAVAVAVTERSRMAGRTAVGLSKVSLLPADEILDGEGCAALTSLLSSLSMMATTAAEVNAYLQGSTILLPRCQIHDNVLLRLLWQ